MNIKIALGTMRRVSTISFNTTLCWIFSYCVTRRDLIFSQFPLRMLGSFGQKSYLLLLYPPPASAMLETLQDPRNPQFGQLLLKENRIQFHTITTTKAQQENTAPISLNSQYFELTNVLIDRKFKYIFQALYYYYNFGGEIGVPLERNLSWRAGKTHALLQTGNFSSHAVFLLLAVTDISIFPLQQRSKQHLQTCSLVPTITNC